MKETLPLERILNQLTDLYHQILSNQEKNLTISPETIEAIKTLSGAIEEISKNTDMEIARMGVTSEMIKQTILGPKTQVSQELQDLLEKSQYLKGQLEGCRNVLKDIMKKQKDKKSLDKAGEKRKDKFKNVGGKKGWIPL